MSKEATIVRCDELFDELKTGGRRIFCIDCKQVCRFHAGWMTYSESGAEIWVSCHCRNWWLLLPDAFVQRQKRDLVLSDLTDLSYAVQERFDHYERQMAEAGVSASVLERFLKGSA